MSTSNAVLIQNLTLDELKTILTDTIHNSIEGLILFNNDEEAGLWTREETAKYLNISLPTLTSYTKKGIIKGYRIEGLVRYRRSEVEASLNEITTTRNKHIR